MRVFFNKCIKMENNITIQIDTLIGKIDVHVDSNDKSAHVKNTDILLSELEEKVTYTILSGIEKAQKKLNEKTNDCLEKSLLEVFQKILNQKLS